jgi:hypothetical protein
MYFIVQTSRTVNFNFVSIEWVKPTAYGDAAVAGYKVYVNGVAEAQLSADELSFTLTGGVPCKDYVFQVQVFICHAYWRLWSSTLC